MRVHFEYARGMIMMKNKSTISMGRALILRVYIRHLQKPATVIIFQLNKLLHHIDDLHSLAFCSERGASIESGIEAPKITASEHGTRQRTLEVVLLSGEF